MATKRKRGSVYEYTIRRSALLPRPAYLRFADEAEGDEYVRRLESLLDRGVVPDELVEASSNSGLLRDELRQYLSTQSISASDKSCLAVRRDRLPKDLALSALTFQWATKWVTSMKREENLSPWTIRHHVGALARFLDWVAAHGAVPVNPLRLLPKGYSTYTDDDARAVRAENREPKTDDERDRRLEDGEEAAIRKVLGGEKQEDRQRALALNHAGALTMLFELALESAMRLSEMYTLDVAQVDLKRRTIFLDKTKNGDKRQVPISSVALAALRGYMDSSGGMLFPWFDPTARNPGKERQRVTSLLSRQFARVFDAAGCADLVFHDLRHEATSRLFERTNLSDMEIAKITGHKSLRMLLRYANLRASNLAERLW